MGTARKFIFLTAFVIAIFVEGSRGRKTHKLKITDCMEDPERAAATLKNYYLTPDPMELPGNLTLGGEIEVHRRVGGRLTGHVEISKDLSLFWFPVPCISNVGTCDYPDLCSMISNKLLENGTDADNTTDDVSDGPPNDVTSRGGGESVPCPRALQYSHVLSCSCPFPPGTYVINDARLEIKNLNSLLTWLATGNYRAKVSLTEDETGETIVCLDLELSVVEGHREEEKNSCSGFLCSLFG